MALNDGDRGEGDAPESWEGEDKEPLETEQLSLNEEEERLPWLESPDDEDEEEGEGNTRLLGFVAMAVIALAAIVGSIWWVTHRNPDPALVADGSIIPAPEGPYKEAPSDPGGKTFDGTGDTSFAVSEGQNHPARLGGDEGGAAAAAPAPAPVAPAQAGAKPGSASPAQAAAAAPGGVGVQVGAFSSKAAAEAGWGKLVGQANGALSGVSHRVVEGSADIGKVYRLQAVAGDTGGANALCAKLKSAGISCQVK